MTASELRYFRALCLAYALAPDRSHEEQTLGELIEDAQLRLNISSFDLDGYQREASTIATVTRNQERVQ